MSNCFPAGIDIGSTTVKLVILDANGQICFGQYRRHRAHTQETLAELLREARAQLGPCELRVGITGSGSMNLGKALGIGFVQEVVAVAASLERVAPQTDVAIELGGEDAKIIYFRGGLEQRMNGVCAGGTGSFIDQMASFAPDRRPWPESGGGKLSGDLSHCRPVRCVCQVRHSAPHQRRRDIAGFGRLHLPGGGQPDHLRPGLWQAHPRLCGLLGGPPHFLPELKRAFIRTLGLTPENVVDPENSHLFAAMGAALEAEAGVERSLDGLISQLEQGVSMAFELKRLPPLFQNQEEYQAFQTRHSRARVKTASLETYRGNCYLGIDSGPPPPSWPWWARRGSRSGPSTVAIRALPSGLLWRPLVSLREKLPPEAKILRPAPRAMARVCSNPPSAWTRGRWKPLPITRRPPSLTPEVDCILDIGGQDMKCIKIRNHSVDTILLNEACSSGCGSFIENFANSLGYTAAQFAQEALFAPQPHRSGHPMHRVYELQCEASPEGRGLGPGYFIRSCLFCH